MKQLYFATRNKGKVNSVRNILSRYLINVIQIPLDLPEPRTNNLKRIAQEKVLFAHEQIKGPCIALDSGFYIHSLKGFPRTFVNFTLETIGIEGILRVVKDKPRKCEFRHCLAYFDKSLMKPKCFESSVEGRLSSIPRGEIKENSWSELFLIFKPKSGKKTLAEMSPHEYNEWRNETYNHSYATKLGEWLSKNYSNTLS